MADLCIPANSTGFIIAISEKLAVTEPSLTLEFLNECFVGFNKSSEPLRHLCLDYMAPWLPNLSIFARNSPEDGKQTLTKTKEVIRLLIDLTVTRNDVSSCFKSFCGVGRKNFHLVKVLTISVMEKSHKLPDIPSYRCTILFRPRFGKHLAKWMI